MQVVSKMFETTGAPKKSAAAPGRGRGQSVHFDRPILSFVPGDARRREVQARCANKFKEREAPSMFLRLLVASFGLGLVALVSDAVDTGGPLAGVALALVILAMAKLAAAMLRLKP